LSPRELFFYKGNWAILFPDKKAGNRLYLRAGRFVNLKIPRVISIGVMF